MEGTECFRHRFHFELPRVTYSCKVAPRHRCAVSRDLLIRLNFICGRKGEAYPSVSPLSFPFSEKFLTLPRGSFPMTPRSCYADLPLLFFPPLSLSLSLLHAKQLDHLSLRSALDLLAFLLSSSKRLTRCIYCGQFLGKRLSTG